MANMKIRTGDTVKVITGKDAGKIGVVMRALPEKRRVVVEKVAVCKKAVRPTQQNPSGGFMEFEAPISVSNVMLVCPSCDTPTRVGIKRPVGEDGKAKRVRYCKRCGATIE